MKARVWITRSEPGATRLAEALNAAGYAAVKRPVLGIEPLDRPCPEGDHDVTVFLSEHAARLALESGWPGGAAVAVGTGTAAVLAARGVAAAVAEPATSEGVVAALAQPPPRAVLIAAGEGGREHVEHWCRERGIDAVKWALYRRRPEPFALAEDERIDAIVVGSGDGLRAVAQMWFAARRAADVPVIVPSARVAALAGEAGFRRVIEAEGARPEAVLEALRGVLS